MTYLSKGAILKASEKNRIAVNRCGCEHILSNGKASLWLAGRFGVESVNDSHTVSELGHLESLGLVETSRDGGDAAGYRLLSNCVICQADPASACSLLGKEERRIWKWITNAGFRLRISELVFLGEQNIKPEPSLVGKDNWQSLVDMIYTTETIFDGILDTNMERSPARNVTVSAVFGLLRKRRILLV